MDDPIKKAEDLARVVSRGDLRKYYRFRHARFYGGIATADCVGCFLRCLFCWSWHEVIRPDACGQFYSPEQVARKLLGIARQRQYERIRISGNEPTLAREHLLKVLEFTPPDLLFILETNGILIGHDASYARELSRFNNLYVRVSLKGTTEEEFSRLTGCAPEGFSLQMRAIENLYQAGVEVQPAVMVSFSSSKGIETLRKRLAQIAPKLSTMEEEELVLYGDVEERLRKANIGCGLGHKPEHIPPEQI
jgi:uncharacterized Fe-S cluster-containing radical SAM superfamily protein